MATDKRTLDNPFVAAVFENFHSGGRLLRSQRHPLESSRRNRILPRRNPWKGRLQRNLQPNAKQRHPCTPFCRRLSHCCSRSVSNCQPHTTQRHPISTFYLPISCAPAPPTQQTDKAPTPTFDPKQILEKFDSPWANDEQT